MTCQNEVVEDNARYDPQTRDLLTEFLDNGKLKHEFKPHQKSYHNICYLNKTRRHVTQECCNRYTENEEYYQIEFKYKGPKERYRIAVNMPMLVTKNMRNKEMYNMQLYNIDSINENDDRGQS